MKERLINHVSLTRRLRQFFVLLTLLLMPLGAWADSYFAINTSTGSYWVTDENATNILGDGKMSYDITNNVLTLDGIDLAFTSDYFTDAFIAMVDEDHPSITVHLKGANTLTLGDKASVFNGTSITFTAEDADASLTIETEDGWTGALFLDSQTNDAITPTYSNNLGYYSSSSEIKYAEPYLLWIGETQVTAANKDDLAAANSNIKVGNATFDPTNNILHLNSIQTKDCIKSELGDLTIKLYGHNRIGYIANDEDNPAIYSTNNGTLTLTKGSTHASLYVETMNVTSVIYGFEDFNYMGAGFNVEASGGLYSQSLGLNDGNYGVMNATFYTGDLYPLWVGETQVTSANLDDIKDDNISEGTVSYDPETNTLTLDNVIADMGNDAPHFIESTVQNLKVKLYDYNKVTLDGEMYGDQICFVKQTGAWTTSTLTFDTGWKNDGYNEVLGQLFIEGSTDETIVAQDYSVSNTFEVTAIYLDPEEAGNATTGWKRGIHEKDPNNNSPDPDYVKIWYLEVYDLWIGSGRVLSSALEAGQSGAPIYNPVNNTLDYNSTNSFPIKSSLPELKISVNGSACGINYESPSTAAITFQATDQQTTGTLKFVVPEEAASNPINKFTVNCELGVISGFSSVTIEEPLALRTPATAPETWGASTTQVVISTFDDSNLFGGGDGSEESPYEISTPQELFLFTQKYNANELSSLSCYVELGDDIDCTGLQGFEPIGTPEMPFIGHFDGASHKISNFLYEAGSEDDYAGLFRKVGDDDDDEPAPGYVLNLTLENCTFRNGNMYNGAIAGLLNKGTIDHCTVTSCSILNETSAPSSGGIVGEQSGGSITNCIVSGSTIAATSTTGGLAGGIVAYIMGSATVSECQVTGTDEKPTTITCSSNYYDSGSNCTGGIVGNCSSFNYDVISISNNKVSGNTTISSIDNDGGNNTCAGAIVGNKGNASFSNNYYYYTVVTSTKNGEAEVVERSGYQQRGTGVSSYDEQLQVVTEDYDIVTDNGAMLYTKKLTIDMEHVVEGGPDGWYEPLSNYQNGIFYLVPGQETNVMLQSDDNYSITSVSLSYTTTEGGDPTVVNLENDGEGSIFESSFVMPDYEAMLNVTFTAKPTIWIGSVEVNPDGTFPDYGETALFDANNKILTLNGISYDGDITSGLDELTIKVTGTNNQISKIVSLNPAATLTFEKASAEAAASLTLSTAQMAEASSVISGFASIDFGDMYLSSSTPYQYDTTNKLLVNAIAEETEELTSATITSETAYPLWIGSTQVTGSSVVSDKITRNGVYEGEDYGITFTAGETNLLQLKRVGIHIAESHKPAIVSGLDNLTIQLEDRNEINFNGDYACYMVASTKENSTLTFKATGDDALLTANIGDSQYIGSPANGFQTVSYNDNLVYIAYSTSTQYIKKLDAPSVSLSDGYLRLSSYESSADNMESLIIKYSVDYVDTSLTDITNETYTEGTSPAISSPCTITAHAEYNGKIGIEATAKYFGFTEPLTITYNGTAFELTTADLPALVPAVADGDDVTYQIGGVSQGTAVNYDEQTQKYMVQGIGTAVLEINLMQGDNTPYQVLNEVAQVTVNVVRAYDLYIGETQVTELNADDVLGDDGTVSFTPEDATNETPATLTLNGAELTAPLIVGLENLTIDIKGENSITTDYTCIQTMDEETTPSLTFKSSGDVVGSLTLTNTNTESLDGVLSSTFENITISRELAPIMLRYGKYTSNTYYLTAGEVHNTQFVPSLGVQVGEIQVYAGNAANVLYDAETPTAVYDVENHKLTLNGARISGAVSTSLENLTIELVGNNSIYQGGSYATLQSMYGEAVTMTIQSTGATPGTLTMNQPYTQAGTFADAHVTLDITSPLTVLSGSLTGNKDNENTVVIGAYTVAFAGTNSWATYYSPVDLAVPEDKGLTAYPVSSVNETTGVVTVPEQGLSYIPANTGVLLKRTDTTVSDYAFTAYTGQTTNITSILQGTSKATSVGGILEGYTDGSTVYVLYNDAFVKTTSGTIPANRGFLVFGDELNAPRLTIEIEGDATGIDTVQGSVVMDNDYYDLSGRKLSGKPTKSGLYIKNGTKVLVK